MRILHTAFAYPPHVSGVPEVVRQISERLASRGHDVHVATGAVDGSPKTEVRNRVTVHRFDVRGNLVFGMSGETNAYIEFVRSMRWDVVASHCAQSWSTDLLFQVDLDMPHVFVAHGLSYHLPIYKNYFGQLAEWLGQKRTMVSLSSVGIDDGAFRRDHSLPEAVIIPNGVDAADWNARELGVRKSWGRDGEPWLINVSNHDPEKSHDRLFELMEQLRSKKQRMHLTQIGRGHYAARWNLGRFGVRGGCYYACKARTLFEKSLTLMLDVPRAVTVSAVKEADLTVLTSSCEASPLVILESMAAGVPFVTLDVGCVREHVGGRVVNSLPEMADTVIELMANSKLREDLGQQGRRRVAERHDWEVVVDAYEHLYCKLISKRKHKMVAQI